MDHKKLSIASEDHYQKDLKMAKIVQQGLLEVETPVHDYLAIASRCVPAENIGGDFYTFIDHQSHFTAPKESIPGIIDYIDMRNDFFGVVIGDVAGHGLGSALVMALSSVIFRKQAKLHKSPSKTLTMVNNDIYNYIYQSPIRYLTAFYYLIDVKQQKLTYSKAGHQPALLIHFKTEKITELTTSGIFLGMYENETYEEKTISIESKDRIVLFTDGITEAINQNNELYGNERFYSILLKTRHHSVDQALQEIFTDIENFSGTSSGRDDRTLVMLDLL